MRNTIIMLTAIGTFVVTWLILASFVYCLSDDVSFKEIMRNPVTMLFMFIIGWIPSVIVSTDIYNSKLNKGEHHSPFF